MKSHSRKLFFLLVGSIWSSLLLFPFLPKTVAQDVPTPFPHLTAINVPGAWDNNYTGKGVVIGIVDDSMLMTHEFYRDRVLTDLCRYFTYDQTNKSVTAENGSNPKSTSDGHGTPVAGSAAANSSSSYSIGGIVSCNIAGPAYQASLVGMGTDLYPPSLTAALRYANEAIDIKNNSYGHLKGFISIFGQGVFSDLNDYDLYNTALAIREATDAGTILVYAAGNSREGTVQNVPTANIKDANKFGYPAHPDTIVVASLGNYGIDDYDQFSSYSCYGSNVFVSAPGTIIPSSSNLSGSNYLSDDSYTLFAGTSAASPVAVGAMALAIEAAKTTNPNVSTMSTRLMKHLLVQTSDKIDPKATGEEAEWTTNGAKNNFSPTYGFGRINTGALVKAAETTLGVTEQSSLTVQWSGLPGNETLTPTEEIFIYVTSTRSSTDGTSLDTTESTPYQVQPMAVSQLDTIPEPTGGANIVLAENPVASATFTNTFTLETFGDVAIQNLEEMTLTLGFSSPSPGDLRIEVTSPSNTTSILCFEDNTANEISSAIYETYWTFTTNAFWGEEVLGEWDINIFDMFGEVDLSLSSLYTTFYMGELRSHSEPGSQVPEPGTWILMLMSVVCLWVIRGNRISLS